MKALQSLVLLLAATSPTAGPAAGYPSHDRSPAPLEAQASISAEADPHGHAQASQEATAGLAWRHVQHFGCGWVGFYLVNVPAYNTLVCGGCGYAFTCFLR